MAQSTIPPPHDSGGRRDVDSRSLIGRRRCTRENGCYHRPRIRSTTLQQSVSRRSAPRNSHPEAQDHHICVAANRSPSYNNFCRSLTVLSLSVFVVPSFSFLSPVCVPSDGSGRVVMYHGAHVATQTAYETGPRRVGHSSLGVVTRRVFLLVHLVYLYVPISTRNTVFTQT